MEEQTLKNYECLGYHGTDKIRAVQILQQQSFIDSTGEEEWLGRGVYFFENDLLQAKNYICKAKKIQDYTIIEVSIATKKLLDLVDTKTFNEFEKFAQKLKNRYKKRKDNRPRKLINAVVLEVMYQLAPYEVVRACFPVPRRKIIERTNLQPMQIQVCVREHNCISNVREVQE